METSRNHPPTAAGIIDWLNRAGLMELEADFPENGDLSTAGMDSMAVMQLVVAAEQEFGVVLGPADLTRANLATPRSLAALIAVEMRKINEPQSERSGDGRPEIPIWSQMDEDGH